MAASYSRIGISPCLAVRARRVRVPGGSDFHLEPGIIGTKHPPQYYWNMFKGIRTEAIEDVRGRGISGYRDLFKGVRPAPGYDEALLIPWADPYHGRK